MSDIIDLKKVLNDKKAKERWDRIQERIKKSREEIEKNPWPMIKRMQEDIISLHIILAEIDNIVYPKVTHLESEFPEYTDLRHEAMNMVAKIRGVLLRIKQ